MTSLAHYIDAIHQRSAVIVGQQQRDLSYQDNGVTVTAIDTRYHFADGVVVQHQYEKDDVEDEQLCAECWSTYTVVSAPADIRITPQRKAFTNHCQELFWLKTLRMQQRD
jgi:hypothetical protein